MPTPATATIQLDWTFAPAPECDRTFELAGLLDALFNWALPLPGFGDPPGSPNRRPRHQGDLLAEMARRWVFGPVPAAATDLFATFVDWAEARGTGGSERDAVHIAATYQAGEHYLPAHDRGELARWILAREYDSVGRLITERAVARALWAVVVGAVDPVVQGIDDVEQLWLDYVEIAPSERTGNPLHAVLAAVDSDAHLTELLIDIDLQHGLAGTWARRFAEHVHRTTEDAVRQGKLPASALELVTSADYLEFEQERVDSLGLVVTGEAERRVIELIDEVDALDAIADGIRHHYPSDAALHERAIAALSDGRTFVSCESPYWDHDDSGNLYVQRYNTYIPHPLDPPEGILAANTDMAIITEVHDEGDAVVVVCQELAEHGPVPFQLTFNVAQPLTIGDPKRRKSCISALRQVRPDLNRPQAGELVRQLLADPATAAFSVYASDRVIWGAAVDPEDPATVVVAAYAGARAIVGLAVAALAVHDEGVTWDPGDWSTVWVGGQACDTGLPPDCDDPLRIARRIARFTGEG